MNTTTTLDHAVEYLISAMQDPSNVHSCHLRMRATAESLNQAFIACNTFAERHKLAKAYPQLLRAGIRFLTRKQTPAEHAAMVQDLCTCSCDLAQPVLLMQHYLARQAAGMSANSEPNTYLMQAVFLIGRHITAALKTTTKSKFKSDKSVDPSATAPWPASPEDLLPYGASDSVEGFDLWAAQAGGEVIYQLAGAMVEFYQPFAIAVLQPQDYNFALRRPLRYLEAAMDASESNPNDAATMFRFENTTTVITSFFGVHLYHNYSGLFVIMLVSHKQIAFPVLDRLWQVVRSRPRDNAVRAGAAVVRDFCKFVIDPVSGQAFLPPGETMDAPDAIPGPDNEVEDALSHMSHVRSGGCLNPTCKSNREGVYTRLCSNCKIVRFCGVECQKAAWKHHRYPHKVLCAKICALKEQLGIKDWGSVLGREREPSETSIIAFLRLCESKGLDLASVQEIGDILQEIRDPVLGNLGGQYAQE